MISFEPFWDMLHEQGITTYDLEYTYEFNPAEISRLKHNHNFTLQFINRLCCLFQCQPSDILAYIDAEDRKKKRRPLPLINFGEISLAGSLPCTNVRSRKAQGKLRKKPSGSPSHAFGAAKAYCGSPRTPFFYAHS